jgi:hypothetical protein
LNISLHAPSQATLKHYLLFLGMYGVGVSLVLGWVFALLVPNRYTKHIDTLVKPLTYAAFIFYGNGLSKT